MTDCELIEAKLKTENGDNTKIKNSINRLGHEPVARSRHFAVWPSLLWGLLAL